MKGMTFVAVKAGFGAMLALGFALSPAATAKASPNEDEPGWSCVDDGNRICGPGNSEGKPAGCYDEGGVLVELWPCQIVMDSELDDWVVVKTV